MSSELHHVVVSAVGPDRPGLVNEISGAVHAAGANLEDTRMAILGGEFAVLMLVTGLVDAVARLEAETQPLGDRLGLRFFVKRTQPGAAPGAFLLYRLKVTGVDRSGIVASVSKVLAGRGVNVASLESRILYAPLSGTPMFVLTAELQVPSETALRQLRTELGTACDEDNLDFLLEGA